ncbi:membrane protein insertion efficiency factor YidD [Shewanella eurypsychrophilus]|uniref:Membrane protein insertion efficiency factor YidD n=1 Tax=Shewanella eurypsychrophilus TaxID=2593656 RepID=A0ABX6V8S7_9GAMM|nr:MULTISPECIES: membrane protein insertion efficiency factor YidD [Shewanella]QFU23706.1 membrane protein insertion efficiency factor YidD [Shewanella sp. YLB-09]QPG58928.1 membrane protein insertion efficiency factor YidD [Shewanella eurypsychrophilus]
MSLSKHAIALINRYQRKGGSKHYFNLECNFTPTCSEYTKQAIEHYGLLSGCKFGFKRIMRCSEPDCVSISHDPLHKEK